MAKWILRFFFLLQVEVHHRSIIRSLLCLSLLWECWLFIQIENTMAQLLWGRLFYMRLFCFFLQVKVKHRMVIRALNWCWALWEVWLVYQIEDATAKRVCDIFSHLFRLQVKVHNRSIIVVTGHLNLIRLLGGELRFLIQVEHATAEWILVFFFFVQVEIHHRVVITLVTYRLSFWYLNILREVKNASAQSLCRVSSLILVF